MISPIGGAASLAMIATILLTIAFRLSHLSVMNNAASHVIAKCGGPESVAAMLRVTTISVRKWTYPRERGGTGGLIPAKRQVELIRAAAAAGITLAPADFFDKAVRDVA